MSDKIFLCAQSLFNISSDLREGGLVLLADLSLFLADNVLKTVEGTLESPLCRGHSSTGHCNGHTGVDDSKSALQNMPESEREKIEEEVMDFIEEIRKDDSESESS